MLAGGGRVKRLTYYQQRIFGRLIELQISDGIAQCTKREIADTVGCSEKTVDRAIKYFREEGLIEVVPCHDENGAQTSNAYRVVHRSKRR